MGRIKGLIKKYIACFGASPRSQKIFAAIASAAISLRIMGLMSYFFRLNVPEWIFYLAVPFLSTFLFYAPSVSPLRSPFWFYRLLGIVVFAGLGYSMSVLYIRKTVWGTFRWALLWPAIWLIPPAACGLFLGLHKLFMKKLTAGKKLGWAYYTAMSSLHPFFRTKDSKSISGGRKIALAACSLLMALSSLMIFATLFLHIHFPSMDAEAIIFTVRFANDGYSPEIARKIYIYAGAVIILAAALSIRLVRLARSESISFRSPDRSAEKSLRSGGVSKATVIFVPIFAFTMLAAETHSFSYLWHLIRKSQIYEEYYVKPTAETVIFPEKKKNLIYIYLESFENSYSTPENGGLQGKDLMPELTKLAQENVNFSHNDLMGGSTALAPSIAYTMGATVAQTSGTLLMTPLGKMRNTMGELESFLPSMRRLEDVLHDNGYEQLFIQGSDADFAGYSSYVGRYEDSHIFDLKEARKQGYIPEDYFQMWGFEDRKVFEFSKKLITEIAAKGRPFAVTMYTMDTHSYEEGYICPLCDRTVGGSFATAVHCTSKQVGDFVEWVKQQPFYEDTVIILTGDHIAEHLSPGIEFEEEDYQRSPYNCFINSPKTPIRPKNRVFSALDMFPTTLSALGCEIKGGRLGLGTDLFSDTDTLCEELGKSRFLDQIQQKSDYVDTEFWK